MEHEKFQASGVFDFTMSKDVAITLDFNRPGASNPVWVYDQYPYDEEGDLVKGIEPIYAFFLKDGAFSGVFAPTTATEDLWFAIGGFGLPTLMEGKIVNGKVEFNSTTRAMIANPDIINDNTVGSLTPDKFFSDGFHKALDRESIRNIIEKHDVAPKSRTEWAYNRLGSFYMWTKTGKPCATSTTSSDPEVTPSSYEHMFMNGSDADAAISFSNGGNWAQAMKPVMKQRNIEYPLIAEPIGNTERYTHFLAFSKDNTVTSRDTKTVKINDASAGTVIIYTINSGAKKIRYDDVKPSDVTPTLVQGETEIYKYEHTFTDGASNHTFDMYSNNGIRIVKIEYTTASRTLHSCTFNESGAVQSTQDFFSFEDNNNSSYTATSCILKNLNRAMTFPASSVKKEDANAGFSIELNTKNSEAHNSKEIRIYLHEQDGFESLLNKERKILVGGQQLTSTKNLFQVEGYPNLRYFKATEFANNNYNVTINPNHGSSASNDWDYNIVYIVCYTLDPETKQPTDSVFCHFTGTGKPTMNQANFFTFSDYFQDKTASFTKQDYPSEEPENPIPHESLSLTHCVEFTSDNSELQVTVPANTKADLTLVFSGSERVFKLNGTKVTADDQIYTMPLEARKAATTYSIKRNSGSDPLHLYFAGIRNHKDDNDEIDWYQTTTYNNNVYAFERDNDTELEAFMTRLENKLWRKSGSKSNAKSQYGQYFNQYLTDAASDKNDINVTKDGTKLYVTFLAEYDGFSANTLGYYVYNTNNKPQTIEDIQEMIILFPNCTSSDYSGSRIYKDADKKYVAEYVDNSHSVIPLKCGDKVQLLYKDGGNHTGFPNGYTNEFPAGVSVGWFLLYNSFDAWHLDDLSIGTGKIRLGNIENNDYSGRTTPTPQVYFADPNLNEADPIDDPKIGGSTKTRCIQLTDRKTNGDLTGYVAICFEDSYTTSVDKHSGNQDKTYDDVIFSVKATPANGIENPSGEDTDPDPETYVSYRESGTYVFEDIWDGSQTDFDMNDVALTYSRLYSIAQSTTKIHKVTERYTVLNDGATYTDAFVVRLPYTTSQIKEIEYTLTKPNGTVQTTGKLDDFVSSTPQSNWTNEHPCVEIDGNNVDIVLFNNINTIEIGLMIDLEISFVEDLEVTSVGTPDNGNLSTMVSSYTKNYYDPFLVVANYTGNDGRCEIHLPGKNTTTLGIVPGQDMNLFNNRWYIANNKFDIALDNMPFALDIPITDFKGCREGVVITRVYKYFEEWVKSEGSKKATWYNTYAEGTAWEPMR